MTAQEFTRYRRLMSGLALPALASAGAAHLSGQRRGDEVLLGVAPARLLIEDHPPSQPQLADGFRALAGIGRATAAGGSPMLRDPSGQARDLYHPFVLHLHLAAFQKNYETLPVTLWGICEDAMPEACLPVRAVEAWADRPPPPARFALILWQALCLLEESQLARRDVDLELVESVVHQIVNQPGPAGSLHTRDSDLSDGGPESLDAWTYRELAGLHALTHLALQRRNIAWSRRVEEIAVYHLENTQPDNTTNQPWGLAGFLWPLRTRSFAEQQIHDAQAHGLGPVAAMLLADSAHALAVFER